MTCFEAAGIDNRTPRERRWPQFDAVQRDDIPHLLLHIVNPNAETRAGCASSVIITEGGRTLNERKKLVDSCSGLRFGWRQLQSHQVKALKQAIRKWYRHRGSPQDEIWVVADPILWQD